MAPPEYFIEPLQRWLAFEAADLARLYDSNDLQRRLLAWAHSAAARLHEPHPPGIAPPQTAARPAPPSDRILTLCSRFGAQNISFGDVEVVPCKLEIKVVFERERHRVIH